MKITALDIPVQPAAYAISTRTSDVIKLAIKRTTAKIREIGGTDWRLTKLGCMRDSDKNSPSYDSCYDDKDNQLPSIDHWRPITVYDIWYLLCVICSMRTMATIVHLVIKPIVFLKIVKPSVVFVCEHFLKLLNFF